MERLLTTDELSEILRVSRRWIQQHVADAGLPHYRLGPARRLIRYRLPKVLEWVSNMDESRANRESLND